MKCLHPIDGHDCGKCMSCRLNRQLEKKTRIMHSAEYYDKKCFLTLTYDQDHVPMTKDGLSTLKKKEAQDFMKRFRRHIEPDEIKYFMCGEYGDTTYRPHYHVILLGVDMFDKRIFEIVRRFTSENWCKCKAWNKGQCTIASFNEARAAYVAKYCLKKWSGKGSKEYYQGREPEFCLSSQGLGLVWLEDHKELVKKEGFVRLGKKRVPLPRYYEEKLFPKDTYRNIDWRSYKQAKGQQSFDEEKKRSGTSDKSSFEKWQEEVRKATANYMATRIQRKGGTHNV